MLHSYMEQSEQKLFLKYLYDQIMSYIQENIVKPYTKNIMEALYYFEDYGIAPDTGNEENDEWERQYNANILNKIRARINTDALSFIMDCLDTLDLDSQIGLGKVGYGSSNIEEYTIYLIEDLMSKLTGINYDYDRMSVYSKPIYMWADTANEIADDIIEYMENKLRALIELVNDKNSELYSNEMLVKLYYEFS